MKLVGGKPVFGRQIKLPRWQRRKGYRVVTQDDAAACLGNPRAFYGASLTALRSRRWDILWEIVKTFARYFPRWVLLKVRMRKAAR